MKVMYLPLNNGDIKQTGMYDAFTSAGVNLTIFDFYTQFLTKNNRDGIRESFRNTAKNTKPDLLHMQLQFTDIIDVEDLKYVKSISPNTKITNWTGDVWSDVPKIFSKVSGGVDLSLISSVGQLQIYKKACVSDVKYWQIGYNPKLYFPQNKTSFKFDLTFVATKYKDNMYPGAKLRTQCAEFLKTAVNNFKLFGHGWGRGVKPIKQSVANDAYNNSFAVLSINNFNNLDCYFSDRLLMCMASGRPTICYRFPGWDEYFTNMKNIVIVNSKEEIVEKFNWLKSHPKIADSIGRNGFETVKREHTYFSRTLELLKMVGVQ